MKIPSNLKLSRHGVYYYRAIIPKNLKYQLDGLSEIKCSLHTKEPALAKLYVQYLNLLLRKGLLGYEKLLSLNQDKLTIGQLAINISDINFDKTVALTVKTPNGFIIEADPNNPNDLASAERIAALVATTCSPFISNAKNNSNIQSSKISTIKASWNDRLIAERIKDKTIDEYQSKLNVFIRFDKDIEVENISSKHVSAFVNQLSSGKITGSASSASTVNKYLCALNSFFNHAFREDLWPANKPFPTYGLPTLLNVY